MSPITENAYKLLQFKEFSFITERKHQKLQKNFWGEGGTGYNNNLASDAII